ncbi:MAG: rRNA maturation RNase YbeY [Firmicutes bacterium]|nr:rRNA maturation RNase YbeY [Bacillota bacterium]
MKHRILISREKRGLGLPNAANLIKRAAQVALEAERVDSPCEISVLLTDDGGIRALNRAFRGADAPTDVLSFPLHERDPETGEVFLGDMALNIPRCIAQGEEYGHGSEREVQYLTVHSVLHLLGYDHVDEAEDKKRMRDRENKIIKMIADIK